MEHITKEEVDNLIVKISRCLELPEKPLMLWIDGNESYDDIKHKLMNEEGSCRVEHPVRGHQYARINGERVKVSDHPELLSNDVAPAYYERAKRLVYYTFFHMADKKELEYGVYQANKLHIPLICLMYIDSLNRLDKKDVSYIEEYFENFIVE